MNEGIAEINNNYESKYGFSTNIEYVHKIRGLSEETIREISKLKHEPRWMLDARLEGYNAFVKKPTPTWGSADISKLDYDNIYYYLDIGKKKANSWEEAPEEIKETFEKLGVPESERKFFAGAEAQFDSNAVYSKINKQLEKQGVIYVDTDTALKTHEDLMKKYFGTVIPPTDNKFAALNTAVWSGGSFIYVPKGVHVTMPLSAYFRINAQNAGQFERTLIIADEGAEVTYLEGCTAPIYSSESLHAAVVEIIVMRNAKVRYITVQNWSKNVYNLVTQRAHVYGNGYTEWIDVNIGSKVNMKYPSLFLREPGAEGKILSVAIASSGQVQDSGGKAYHLAPDTRSSIISKSISIGSGNTTYRGLVHVSKEAERSLSFTQCDAMLIDDKSLTNTFPYTDIRNNSSTIAHEASVGRISEDQLTYLESRGISEEDAKTLIVMGFLDELTKSIPLEYSIELYRLVKMKMKGSVG